MFYSREFQLFEEIPVDDSEGMLDDILSFNTCHRNESNITNGALLTGYLSGNVDPWMSNDYGCDDETNFRINIPEIEDSILNVPLLLSSPIYSSSMQSFDLCSPSSPSQKTTTSSSLQESLYCSCTQSHSASSFYSLCNTSHSYICPHIKYSTLICSYPMYAIPFSSSSPLFYCLDHSQNYISLTCLPISNCPSSSYNDYILNSASYTYCQPAKLDYTDLSIEIEHEDILFPNLGFNDYYYNTKKEEKEEVWTQDNNYDIFLISTHFYQCIGYILTYYFTVVNICFLLIVFVLKILLLAKLNIIN